MTLHPAAAFVADQKVQARFDSIREVILEFLKTCPEQERGAETLATVGALSRLLRLLTHNNPALREYAQRWENDQ